MPASRKSVKSLMWPYDCLEHEIVDLLGRLVTGIVMRVGWVAPEIAFGDKMEAGRFDFLSQRAFLDAVQGLPTEVPCPGNAE